MLPSGASTRRRASPDQKREEPESVDRPAGEPGVQDVTLPGVPSTLLKRLGELRGGEASHVEIRDVEHATPLPRPGRDAHLRYVFQGEVGRGGMGAVLKVYDNDLRRHLAMKVVLGPSSRGDELRSSGTSIPTELVERFLAEAQITGQLDHPGVVPVHEIGVDEEQRMYFTMRLVRGMTLDEVFRHTRAGHEGWNLTRALHSFLKVCETVAFAHARLVVHRDLKPENVMIGRFGETYVMDWGSARVLDEDATKRRSARQSAAPMQTIVRTSRKDQERLGDTSPGTTQEGMIVGTPFYMPREQALGQLDEIGPQTDVYAVGSMLYELLTGRRPYQRTDRSQTVLDVIGAIVEGPPTPAHELAKDAPPELLAICEKAMAYEWRDRYPSMVDMAEDLRAFLEGRVVAAYDTGTRARLVKWIKRNKPLAGALAAILALIAAGIGFVILQQQEKLAAVREQQALTEEARSDAEQNALAAERNAEQAWREGYVASVVAANASLRANEVREAKRLLEGAREDLRQWEWQHLSFRADSSLVAVEDLSGPVLSVAFSADGGGLLVAGDGRVRLLDPATGAARLELADGLENVVAAAFARDGGVLAFSGWSDPRLRTFDPSSGELVGVMALPVPPTSTVTTSADGRLAAYASNVHVLHVIELASGRPLHTLEAHDGTVHALRFLPDGERLVSVSEDGTARVWDLASGALAATHESPDGALLALALDPAGDSFVTGGANGAVRRWSLATGPGAEPLLRHGASVYGLAFSEDGAQLASVSLDKTVRVLELATGRERVMFGHDAPIRTLAFAPGASRIATGSDDGALRVWDVRASDAVSVVDGPDDFVRSVAVSPDGSRIALGTHFGGSLQVIDRATGDVLVARAGADDPVNAVAFSPDGRELAAAHEEAAVVVLRDAATLEERLALAGHEASVTSLSWSPDGAQIASGSTDWTARVWSTGTGEQRLELSDHPDAVEAVAFAPDGARLAVGCADGTVVLWNARTGARERALAGHGGGALSLAWSPDGSRLAVGSGDHRIRIWDPAGDAPERVLAGHDQRVSALDWSPDGERLLSGSYDDSLRLWDVATGKPVLTLREHTAPVTSVAFAPDGGAVVSGSFDNQLRIWRAR